MMKLSIVIPCYNERNTFLQTLLRVERAELGVEKEIIVVDDGSTDGTRELLRTLATHTVVLLDRNQGKGAALRAGFARASGDYVVVQDADAEYDPQDLRRLVDAARTTGARVIYGSRRLGASKNPKAGLSYYAGGVALTTLANILYGIHITDEPTCYKMFARDVLRQLDLTCTGFEFCPEATAKTARLGEQIVEVPISYHPRSRAAGKKIRWTDGAIAVWTLIKYRFWMPGVTLPNPPFAREGAEATLPLVKRESEGVTRSRLLILTQAVDANDSNLGFFMDWIRGFAARATQVTILCHRRGSGELPQNVRVRATGSGLKVVRYLKLAWWSCIETRRHDAVFAHMAPEFALLAGFWAQLRFRRLGLWYVHKAVTRRLAWATRLADVVFTASPESFRLPSRASKVRILGHGIPLARFAPRTNPLPASPLRILSVSRLSPAKGVQVILDAFALLKARRPDIELTVAGNAFLPEDRTHADDLRRRGAELGVRFVGNVRYDDLPELYRQHQVFVHASETGSLDKVVLEAAAAGLIVISSSDAYATLLPPERRFAKGDAQALADALMVVQHASYDDQFGVRVRADHDLDQLLDRIAEDLFDLTHPNPPYSKGGREGGYPSLPLVKGDRGGYPSVSAVILTYNSAATLEATLQSVESFAEKLIVDGGSTDATLDIARRFGCRIMLQSDVPGPITDYAAVRERAARAAVQNWVFMLDSDETVSSRLVRSIAEATARPPAAYWTPRRYVLDGQMIRYAATYPNRQMRFFHRSLLVRYENRVHERPSFVPDAKMDVLDGWLEVPLGALPDLRRKWSAQASLLLKNLGPLPRVRLIQLAARESAQATRQLFRAFWLALRNPPDRLPFDFEAARMAYYSTLLLGLMGSYTKHNGQNTNKTQ